VHRQSRARGRPAVQAVLDTAAAQREARLFEDAAAGRGGPGAAPAQVRAAAIVGGVVQQPLLR